MDGLVGRGRQLRGLGGVIGFKGGRVRGGGFL